jgi:hypothetical protein
MPTKTKKTRPVPPITFYSTLFTTGMIKSVGDISRSKNALRRELEKRGVNTKAALQSLPKGAAGDVEAVTRLVSLARANGYWVRIATKKTTGETFLNISLPSMVPMLQHGHHEEPE